MRISVDLDGVLANFTGAVVGIANRLWPDKKLPDTFEPDNWGYAGALTPQEFSAVWDEILATKDFWRRLSPYPENVQALRRFIRQEVGVDIFYVTSRVATKTGDTLLRQCEAWLFDHELGYGVCSASILPVSNPAKKIEVMDALGIEMSIDDYHKNAISTASLPGHQTFLLNRPWNIKETVPDNVVRVPSLYAYLHAVSTRMLGRARVNLALTSSKQ